jgi:hypothetical protein
MAAREHHSMGSFDVESEQFRYVLVDGLKSWQNVSEYPFTIGKEMSNELSASDTMTATIVDEQKS